MRVLRIIPDTESIMSLFKYHFRDDCVDYDDASRNIRFDDGFTYIVTTP